MPPCCSFENLRCLPWRAPPQHETYCAPYLMKGHTIGWVNATWGTNPMSRFGDTGIDRCSMCPKRSLERVFFSLKSPFLRGVQRHVLGLQCHQSGCNFWLVRFGWINGTWGICQTSRFGDGGPERCSMGPKPSLERVFFSLKSPFLRGVQRHVLGLQCHQSGYNFWLE